MPNLYDCLFNLRTRGLCNWLWVDAVCINQEDSDEKAEQIQKMRHIYRHASRVVAYAGEGDDESGPHLHKVSELIAIKALLAGVHGSVQQTLGEDELCPGVQSRYARAAAVANNGESVVLDLDHFMQILQERPALVKELAALLIPERTIWGGMDVGMSQFNNFIRRKLWTRVWIVQEFASARNITLVWLDQTISLRKFFVVWAVLYYYANTVAGGCVDGRLVRSIAPLLLQSYCLRDGRKSRTLLELLRATGDFEATDPRDKVYALLGIAKDAQELGIHPDYSQTYEEHCQRVGRALFQKYGPSMLSFSAGLDFRNVHLLTGTSNSWCDSLWTTATCGHGHRIPSWCPDWTLPCHHTLVGDRLPGHPRYRASGDILAPLGSNTFDDGQGTLSMAVVRIGIVERAQETIDLCPDGDTKTAVLRLFANIRKLLEKVWDPEAAQSDVEMAQFCIPIAFQPPDGRWMPEDAHPIHQCLVEGYRAVVDPGSPPLDQERDSSPSEGLSEVNLLKMLPPAAGKASNGEEYLLEALRRAHWRRLFTLGSRYLGLGPNDLNDGDAVVIFPGGHVPYIIRQHPGGADELIGEAFILGLMFGEHFERNKNYHIENLTLR